MIHWPKLILAGFILAALAWAVIEIREDGAQSVKNSIERQNNEAAGQSDTARSSYDRCLDGGGLWNFGAQQCDRASSGRRD
jgi:hypothetical protein